MDTNKSQLCEQCFENCAQDFYNLSMKGKSANQNEIWMNALHKTNLPIVFSAPFIAQGRQESYFFVRNVNVHLQIRMFPGSRIYCTSNPMLCQTFKGAPTYPIGERCDRIYRWTFSGLQLMLLVPSSKYQNDCPKSHANAS